MRSYRRWGIPRNASHCIRCFFLYGSWHVRSLRQHIWYCNVTQTIPPYHNADCCSRDHHTAVALKLQYTTPARTLKTAVGTQRAVLRQLIQRSRPSIVMYEVRILIETASILTEVIRGIPQYSHEYSGRTVLFSDRLFPNHYPWLFFHTIRAASPWHLKS